MEIKGFHYVENFVFGLISKEKIKEHKENNSF